MTPTIGESQGGEILDKEIIFIILNVSRKLEEAIKDLIDIARSGAGRSGRLASID